MLGYGLIKRQQNSKFKLTDRGRLLAEQIKADGNLMVVEINDLCLLSKSLTENKVDEMIGKWGTTYADD